MDYTKLKPGDWADMREIDHFVEFDDVPDESEDFYNMISQIHADPDIIEDSACLLGQIESFDKWGRYRTVLRDRGGARFIVAFYLDNGNYGKWDFSKLKVGHTMAIMYPESKTFLDGTRGCRIEDEKIDNVTVGLHPCLNPKASH